MLWTTSTGIRQSKDQRHRTKMDKHAVFSVDLDFLILHLSE
jgi:hypothetical protein